ncbi:fungal-specific transcription factor domain-containing protein [Dendryphion nanum]|uniref:Fungal-specific transcription factor domain-containing protein n=1 Tax=Dendryphion nanum TaxID=256645 RepID=A0A9P9ID94_9PLEO|nr:fungal-specific transcription factor domain-containing protein [Dendryphion nanum]
MASNSNGSFQNRPYRSHRVPACTRCRSRKIRCHIDIPGEPCLSCRERRLKCQYADAPKGSPDEDGEVRPPKRPRLSNSEASGEGMMRSLSAPILHKTSMNPSASIMLAPHVAEDVDILQRHISKYKTSEGETSQAYQTLLHDAGNPIVYLSVPRYRTGLLPAIGAGKEQLEVIEQIMGPFKREVIDLYFKHLHPHFPVLDKETCVTIQKGPMENVPKPLLCVVYANSYPNWRKSDTLKMHPKPDFHYIWNKTISAVLEDFLSPSLATVAASVLDGIGRPSVSIVGNATLVGRNVALAQTFGLHRDPSKWEISDNEKSTRIRVWWGVLITDYWSSIAYGNPPHIHKGYYDVPLPTITTLLSPKSTPYQKYASTCFVHLCALTQLLGDILAIVYHIGPDPATLSASVTHLKSVLNDLESQLPEWLPLPDRPGSSNLWFCFLSMRLLLSRVALRAAVLMHDPSLETTRLAELDTASAAVLDFILSLGDSQFHDFWVPYATHLLVLAVNVSLRCTVDAQDARVRNASITRLERVVKHIQHAHDNFDWDIARYCLERCSDPVAKMAALVRREDMQGPRTIVPQLPESNSVELQARAQAQSQAQNMSFTNSMLGLAAGETNTALQQQPSSSMTSHPFQQQQHQQLQAPSAGLTATILPGPGTSTSIGTGTNGIVNPMGVAAAAGNAGISTTTAFDDSSFLLADTFDPAAFDFSWEALWDTPSGMLGFSL